MTRRWSQGHPIVLLAVYLLVPVSLNAAAIALGRNLLIQRHVLVLRLPGVLVGIQWGWAGIVACALVGFTIGVPVAMMQTTCLRDKLRAGRAGTVPCSTFLSARYVLCMTVPWLVAFAAGHLLGDAMAYKPIGGALIASDVLLARVLVYRSHRDAWLWVLESQSDEGRIPVRRGLTEAIVGPERQSA
jgi:hypothetical protein